MITTLVAAGAAAAVLGAAVIAALTRRSRRVASPAPGAAPRQPDFFDGAFSLASVARRTRQEAALAGRAAAEGRPIADRLEDLPSRRWIEERIEERIAELRRDLIVGVAELDERAHGLARQVEGGRPRRDELQTRVDGLAGVHRTEIAKPRHEQDLAVERRLNEAREELRAIDAQLAESELRREELVVRRDRLPAQTEAEIAYLREACDTLQLEHDMAYEAAEHRHPDKQSVTTPPAVAPPAAVVALAAISQGARREGTLGGHAATLGTGPAAVEELPGRRWITMRFGEHIAAVKAQGAAERRVTAEEIAVVAEQIRQADRAVAKGEALLEALTRQRPQAEAAGRLADHERHVHLAERALHATEGRRHEYELLRERLTERQRGSDADRQARVEFLKQALAAAIAEHDLAFHRARRVIAAPAINGQSPSANGADPAHFIPPTLNANQ